MERRSDPDQPPSPVRRKLLLALGSGGLAATTWWWTGRGPRPSGQHGAGHRLSPPSVVSDYLDATATAPSAPAPRLPASLDPDLEPRPPGYRYERVIAGGRVIDPESGFDGLANVGIDGAVIVEISPLPLDGEEVIDATGRVVAPGFIDLLSAEPNEFGVWLKVADGVTTNLAMHGINGLPDTFFDRYQRSPVHFGGAFHHHYVRGQVLGAGIGAPLSDRLLGELEDLLRRSLEGGFAGVSFSPEYSPGTTTEEMERLAAVAAEYGHGGFIHLRHSDPEPPGTSLEALDEAIEIARRTGIAMHVEHLTSTGGTHVMAEAVARIDRARTEGIDITACLYPYNFWGTYLASARFSQGWQERFGITYDDLQIAGTEQRLAAESWNQAVGENHLVAALNSIPDDEVALALSRPWALVASDGIITSDRNNHPRGAGTFARTLARYVRQDGLLDLRTALAKMTILPALRMQTMVPALARKGRLQRGADADICVFDPVTIEDRATVAEPDLPSVGIDWVLVDGQVVLADGAAQQETTPGRPLRSRA